MSRLKRSPMAPPQAWVELLQMHDLELNRVRMLWRRGAGKYQALLHSSESDAEEWGNQELVDTHFDWRARGDESVQQQRERITETVEGLWNLAIEWTTTHGPKCDFKLCGWDQNNDQLFGDGRRCTLGNEFCDDDDDATDHDVPPGPRSSGEAPPWREGYGGSRAGSWAHLDNLKDQFLNRLTEDRNWSFDTAQKAMDVAPELLTQAGEVLKDTIVFQRDEVAKLRDRSTGQTELRARAFAEMERSRRTGMTMEFLRYAFDGTVAVAVPLANRLFEVLGNRSMQVFPEFKNAQQALAYLSLTFTGTQLQQLFPDKARAAGAFRAVLHDASKMEFERQALEHVADLLVIFRDTRFRDVATPEQQLAGNFILGRMALFRMNEYEGPEATDP